MKTNKQKFRISNLKTRMKGIEEYKSQIKKQLGEAVGFLGVYRTELLDMITGEKVVKYYHNIIPNVALAMITNNLTDPTPDNDMLLTHVALGDDATLVSVSDVKLTNETYRNAIISKTNALNVAYITGYFSQTEVSGTFKEAGIFSDASLTVDSGILVSHVNIDVAKTVTQKLTIDWALTLLNV